MASSSSSSISNSSSGEEEVDASSLDGSRSCTIQIPEDLEEKCTYLVNFSNGQLVHSSHPPKITLYNKTNDRTKKKRILVAETDGLSYVGTNFSSDTSALSNFNQYFIGALDKETGKMTLHRTELITLHPSIPGAVESEVGEEIVPDESEDSKKTVNEMVQLFGSERRKKAFSAAQRNQVESGILETALEPAFSHAQTKTEDTSMAETSAQSSNLKPPHSLEAEAPQDVYDLHDIISLTEFRLLKDMTSEFTTATDSDLDQWRAEKSLPEYILDHIPLLPASEPERSLKATILLYASILIELQSMNSRRVERTGICFEGIAPPDGVLELLLDKFTEKLVGPKRTQYSLPVRVKDKIRLHLLVLCLIIDDFTVDCSVLQKDLKVTTNKMMDYFRALGCAARKNPKKPGNMNADTSCTCSLKIPLVFPKPRQGKKRKEY